MRLKLTVQRHSLPPAHVLWIVGVPRPPHSAAGASITVSQFLEQVNDVIPLESEEWGLEDYAVEVGGFECLHFSELTQVLKEDDEVWYREHHASRYSWADSKAAFDRCKLPTYAFEGSLDAIRSPPTVGT